MTRTTALAVLLTFSLMSACTVIALPPDTDSDGGESTATKPIDACDCYEQCGSIGFYCANASTCECGDIIDVTCSDGAHKLCECAGHECSFEEWLINYVTCFQWEEQPNAEFTLCLGVFYGYTCDIAVQECTQ